jgi:cytochrome c oxidase subunit II
MWLALLLAALLTGCSGVQSTLEPAGREGERIAHLFWWMTGVSLFIWIGVIGLTLYATRCSPGSQRERQARWLIYAGAGIPTVVLTFLLAYGLSMFPETVAPAPTDALRIKVTGEQWWWRVRYEPRDGQAFDLANEVRLPAGAPVEFTLESRDVIHSFWIPALGGKMDMIPGRVNRLVLHPTKIGQYRGTCAEYCGTSHANMAFVVKVTSAADFEDWLASQSRPQTAQAGAP